MSASRSPFFGAGTVSEAHGDFSQFERTDEWPYMRTAYGAAVGVSQSDTPSPVQTRGRMTMVPQRVSGNAFHQMSSDDTAPKQIGTPIRRTGPIGQGQESYPPPSGFLPSSKMMYNQQAVPLTDESVEDQQLQGAYTKLVKSSTLHNSFLGVTKHVFKVREGTKLILFLGAAAGGILLLDLTARLLISIAHNRCSTASTTQHQ